MHIVGFDTESVYYYFSFLKKSSELNGKTFKSLLSKIAINVIQDMWRGT